MSAFKNIYQPENLFKNTMKEVNISFKNTIIEKTFPHFKLDAEP